jgi:hypothetical protein
VAKAAAKRGSLVKKGPKNRNPPPLPSTRPASYDAIRVHTAAEIKAKVLDFRLSGMTQSDIGRELGITQSRVCQIITAHLVELSRENTEQGEKLLEYELQRLNALLVAHWPLRKDTRHAQTILSVLERRHKLLGLDAPTKVQQVKPAAMLMGGQLDISKLNDEQLTWLEIILEVAGPAADDSVVATQSGAAPAALSDLPQDFQ